MAAERNDFNINLGDTIYSDSEVADAPVARTVPEKWGKYKLGLALPALQRLRASTGLYSHWDDHEFINDFSKPEHGGDVRRWRQGLHRLRARAGDWATRPLPARSAEGRTSRLFFLDERSFRSAKADDACNGDLAPTVPQSVRNAFATLAPGLRNPVSQACRDALNDQTRTMLGAAQYAAFTKAIKASKATWKVVVNEVPIQQFYALPYDRWEGYAAERERLVRFLQANVKNVVFLTTDTHANLVNEVRYRTFSALESSASGRSSPVLLRRTVSRTRSTTTSLEGGQVPPSARSSSSRPRRTEWACAAAPRHVQLRPGHRDPRSGSPWR